MTTGAGKSRRALGRGTGQRPDARYLAEQRETIDDGWEELPTDARAARPRTTVTDERPRTIINRNDSPDIPFEQSINPFRGCEHGCIYCYARPAHAYVDLSPGVDFETRLFAKPRAAELLRAELAKPGYRCSPIALGANTDAYQPIERQRKITRSILEVLAECAHPVTIVSKSALVERDLDLLADMARADLVQVFISVTTLDVELARHMEPRAAAPARRLQTLARLAEAGIPTGVMFAPVIPALNDHELEAILAAAAERGVAHAGYVLLRLPREVNGLFKEWLERCYPLRASHVMSRVRAIRDGAESDANFGTRLKGTGVYARLLADRFARAARAEGLNRSRHQLNTTDFKPPGRNGQLSLF